jgi:hypothetical protein
VTRQSTWLPLTNWGVGRARDCAIQIAFIIMAYRGIKGCLVITTAIHTTVIITWRRSPGSAVRRPSCRAPRFPATF